MKIGVMLRAIDEKQGIGIYTQNLMDHLLPLDKTNEYVLFYRNPDFLGRYAEYSHVREKLIKAPNKVIWDQLMIPLEAKREGVDLIFHTKFTLPLVTRCKTVMSLHGSEWFIHPRHYKLLDRINIRVMMPLYCSKSNMLVSNSDLTKHDFVDILGLNKQKIKTIYFGYDPCFKQIDDSAILQKAKERYQLPNKFILCVSSKVYPGKNLENLFHAYAQIKPRIEHKIVIAGPPPHKKQSEYALIRKIGLEGNIFFTGWVPQKDLVALYNLADLFIFPSFYEAFGLPLLEAMACGCPVIASSTGALPEIAGEAALFVDPQNPDEIDNALSRLINDEKLRKRLIQAGFRRARSFSWVECARETLRVFESLKE